jgi:hypothetical protein
MHVIYDERALHELEQASIYYASVAGEAKAREIIARIRRVIVARARVGFGKAAYYNVDDDIYEVPVSGLPYVVSYQLHHHTIVVVAVSNTNRGDRPGHA